MLATAVSAANDCFFCMDSHAAHATAVMEREGGLEQVALLDTI
jgi:AhpD family alkylhydroperoxidase